MTDQKWAEDFATSALIWARNYIRRASLQRYEAVQNACRRYLSADLIDDIDMGIYPRRSLAASPTCANAFAYMAVTPAPSRRGYRVVN
jgi:hypothetical protein